MTPCRASGSRTPEKCSYNANLTVSVLFYITDLLLFYQFWRYARAVLGLEGAEIKKLDFFLKILLIPGIALCISNFFTPVLFSISENGVFLKAPGYLITLLILIRILGRTFIDPIHSISGHIENFLSEGIPDKKPIRVWGGFEIERLAGSFKSMTSQLSDYEEKLKKETAERERISVELNLASSIQSNHLPNN